MIIGLSSWSLHRELEKGMDIYSFLDTASKRYEVEAVEIVSVHLGETERDSLSRLSEALAKNHLRLANIPIDGPTALDVALKRVEHLDFFLTLMDAAATLGATSVRVNSGGSPERSEDFERVVEGYRLLAGEAAKRGLFTVIENHGGLTARAETIVHIIRETGMKQLGTCPDTGNFAPAERYRELELVAPYMKIAHIKTYEFDQSGNERNIDVSRCVEIFRRAGFDGVLSIEYEGEKDALEGVEKSVALLRRVLRD